MYLYMIYALFIMVIPLMLYRLQRVIYQTRAIVIALRAVLDMAIVIALRSYIGYGNRYRLQYIGQRQSFLLPAPFHRTAVFVEGREYCSSFVAYN
jgi:hypothetical protein